MLVALSIFVALQLPAQDAGAQQVAPVVRCAVSRGIDVEFGPLPADAWVLGNRVQGFMIVNHALDAAGRVGAMLYQLAYFRHPDHLLGDDRNIWSESVAGQVLARLKLPTKESDGYLAQFEGAPALQSLERATIDAEVVSIYGCVSGVSARAQ